MKATVEMMKGEKQMMKLNGRVVVTGKTHTRKAEKQVLVLLIVT